MTNNNSWQLYLLAISFLTRNLLLSDKCLAQIIPDNTLPTNSSIVEGEGCTVCTIEDGTQRGNNLFHSFEQFSVPVGGEAFFNNNADIQNIFSRVTGGLKSKIDGIIRANGAANLFFINPNGIIFGPQASLNIGGSFIGSTASSIVFPDAQFSATAPNREPLLSINLPIGLQFGTTVGDIQVQRNSLSELKISPGKTFGLVGGNIHIEGRNIFARGFSSDPDGNFLLVDAGRVELGSVSSSSEVSLQPAAQGWQLIYEKEKIPNFQDINLSQSFINADGAPGGDVRVQGRRIILNQAAINASTSGSNKGGDVIVNASDSLEFIQDPGSGFSLGILTGTTGAGDAGNIIITTPRLLLQEGGALSSESTTIGSVKATGAGGDIIINAPDSITLSSKIPTSASFSSASILASTLTTAPAGNIEINTGRLTLEGKAQISSSTLDEGQGGAIKIKANTLELRDTQLALGTKISVASTGAGNAGSLDIQTNQLNIFSGAEIFASTLQAGNAGDIIISPLAGQPLEVNLVGADTGIFANAEADATGKSGSISLTATDLIITDGATIAVDNQGTNIGGILNLQADSVSLDNSSLTAATASSQGGNITLGVNNLLSLANGSAITASAGAEGDGGNITIDAGFIQALPDSNQISADAFEGNGGNITITTNEIFGGQFLDITASSEFGLDGTVTINNPEIDPNQSLVELTSQTANPQPLEGCQANVKAGTSFINVGRGGMTPTASEPLSRTTIWEDIELPQLVAETPERIVEAQGWIINDEGKVVLVAQMPRKLGCR